MSTTVGKNSLEKNGVAIMVNKSPKCSTWKQFQKWQNDLCLQGKPFDTMVIQVYTLTIMLKKLKMNGSMNTYNTFYN